MPIVLLEAMSYALPIVASDIRVHREVLSGVGMFFQNKNVADLRDKMAFLLNAPEEGARLGIKARERIRKEYSWEAVTEKTLAVYRSLLPHEKGFRRCIPHRAFSSGRNR